MTEIRSIDVTDEMIKTLREEALEHGDTTMARTCDRALGGADVDAFKAVLTALNAAAALRDT